MPPDQLRTLIDATLHQMLPRCSQAGADPLNDAMRVAVWPGGKRLRPVFTILAAHAAGVPAAASADAACAVELLHSSSLIFDDLPCMDDAALRRNRPSLHRIFGESMAILAGLAILNEAYRVFGRSPRLASEAARCIGVHGMIGGQAADLIGADFDSRDRKTTALMRLTLVAGAIAGGATEETVRLLGECGERLGRAYQMLDDLVDAREDRGGSWQGSREAVFAEVNECCRDLTGSFGAQAGPLILAVETVFTGVAEEGLVAA